MYYLEQRLGIISALLATMLVYFFIVTFIVKGTDAAGFKKEMKENCEENTSQTVSLFNLMCSNVANEEESVLEDACVGCFSLASRATNNQPSLTRLVECANLYLVDTRYDDCVSIITNAQSSTKGDCINGYCPFVRCVRRINADLLIARCYTEASADNGAELEEEQIVLYKNITSCILAISRCSSTNPITGQSQTSTVTSTTYGKFGLPTTTTVPLYNALQINQAGDLRTVAFPGTTNIQKYFCPYEFNLKESSWMDYTC